jgi:DNA-binding transcriptional ArsR family regulator
MHKHRSIALAGVIIGFVILFQAYLFCTVALSGQPDPSGTAGNLTATQAEPLQHVPLGQPRQVPMSELPMATRVECDLRIFFLLLHAMLPLYAGLLLSRPKGLLDSSHGLLLGMPLLYRRKNSKVLADNTRKMVYDHVVDSPGCTRPQIARDLGLNEGTVTYHLDVLEGSNCLRTVKVDKTVYYFANNRKWDELELRLYIRLHNETGRLLLNTMMEQPQITSKELSRLSGRNKSTISWHMERLEKDGIISVHRVGRNCFNSISDRAAPLLARLMSVQRNAGMPAAAYASVPDQLHA